MNPIGPQHCELVRRLSEWTFDNIDRQRWSAWIQQPIALYDSDSVPEPDVAWVANQSYSDRYPRGEEVGLVIEVCNSSHAYDRGTKSEIYASAGIREYWIVDAVSSTIEIRRRPDGETYTETQKLDADDEVSPLCQPEAILHVSELFS